MALQCKEERRRTNPLFLCVSLLRTPQREVRRPTLIAINACHCARLPTNIPIISTKRQVVIHFFRFVLLWGCFGHLSTMPDGVTKCWQFCPLHGVKKQVSVQRFRQRKRDTGGSKSICGWNEFYQFYCILSSMEIRFSSEPFVDLKQGRKLHLVCWWLVHSPGMFKPELSTRSKHRGSLDSIARSVMRNSAMCKYYNDALTQRSSSISTYF